MKPISDKAFSEICNQFSLDCEDYCSQATYLALSQIAGICSPETYPETQNENFYYKEGFLIYNQKEGSSEKESFIEYITPVFELIINSKESFEEYVGEYALMEEIEIWYNGRFGGTDPTCELCYADDESFLKDIDYRFVRRNVIRCWDRACETEKPFPVKKVYKLLAADWVGTSERIG